ncbi:hypothetical protein BGZ68_000545 [Mortierella alpina]|nr:hypothetical protein BGZ68_000545 [Mortierella alpina]
MHWSTWSKPFFGITGALALLQIAQANSAQGTAEVAPVGQEGHALKAAVGVPRGASIDGSEQAEPELVDKIFDSSRNTNGPGDSPDISSSTGNEISPAVDNSDENDTYKPIRHDIRRQVDACLAASNLIGGRIPYEFAKACLDADFPFPSTLREDTAKTVKTLISSFYVFEDLAARPPTGDHVKGLNFTPVNIVGEIDQLLEKSQRSFAVNDEVDSLSIDDDDEDEDEGENEDEIDEDDGESENEGTVVEDNQVIDSTIAQDVEPDNNQDEASTEPVTSPVSPTALLGATPMTHREFHDGISRILVKARDGHLSYDADCFRAFEFKLGFYISHIVRDGRTVLKVHYVEPYFAETNRLYKDIRNCEVVKIGGQNAADYIQQWADKHVYVSKDPNVRFNAALARPVYSTLTSDTFLLGSFGQQFKLPEEPSLSFEFQCPGYFLFWPVAPIKADVRWTASYNHQPFTDTSSYYEANCIKPGFDDNEVVSSQDGHSANAASEPQTPPEAAPPQKASTVSSNAKDNTDKKDAQDARKKVDETLTTLSQFTSEQLPVVKYYDDHGSVTEDVDWTPDAASVRELYRGRQGISALLMSDEKTGIITVPSVTPENSSQSFSDFLVEWVDSVIEAINTLRPRAENLILDLSRNGGGYICVGTVLLNLFFPDQPRQVTNIRLSPIGKQMMRTGALGVNGLMSSYGTSTESVFNTDVFPGTITHPHRPNMTFTNYVSDQCSVVDQYELTVNPEEESKRKRASSSSSSGVYHPWDPENLAILTDGNCGSTCALITNVMHSKFNVKTVVIGGKSPASAEKMSYSTFPGLQVIDDAYIFSNIKMIQRLKESNRDTEGLEKGAPKGKAQKSFAVGNNKEEKEVEDDKPGYSELDVPYPADFAHKSRLRLTWRQIYRTGSSLDQFVHSEKDDTYKPAWGDVEQWNEYSFIPADNRIDYTENNVRSSARTWVDTRDVVWGPSE